MNAMAVNYPDAQNCIVEAKNDTEYDGISLNDRKSKATKVLHTTVTLIDPKLR